MLKQKFKSIDNLFITHELALNLKQLGYNEFCFRFYNNDGSISKNMGNEDMPYFTNTKSSRETFSCSAPLYTQVIDWLREEKKLQIELTCWYGTSFWKFEIYRVGNNNRITDSRGCYNLFEIDWAGSNDYHKKHNTSSVYTYYEATKRAIEECITILNKK